MPATAAMYSCVYGAMPGEPQEKRRRSETRTPSPGLMELPNMLDCDASPLATSGSSAGSPATPEYLSASDRYLQTGGMVPTKHSSESLDVSLNGCKEVSEIVSMTGGSRSISLVVPRFQGMEVIDPRQATNQNPVIPIPNLKFSVGTSRSMSLSPQAKSIRTPKGSRKARCVRASMEDAPSLPLNESMDQRRQKRLERNRESARLSRRRRKQYLDVLEERVAQLSIEMDQGRRDHVMEAILTIQEKRRQVLFSSHPNAVKLLDTSLSRSSLELRVASTFHTQQLKSFALPLYTKFLLWLTLQSDIYFRGGRAASERLSAARIGERMLSSGTDSAAPSQAMWPLLCHDIGLSYDQEERIRGFQRALLQTPESWLHRHTALASDLAMSSAHDSIQGMSARLGQRDSAVFSTLSEQQRLKFQSWAIHNKDRIARLMGRKMKPKPVSTFKTSPKYHVAANLYIINHHLQYTPRAASLVGASLLKKLMQRPAFESLGCAGERSGGKEDGSSLSRDNSFPSAGSFPSSNSLKNSHSFASSGSLKRSASEMSIDEEEGRPQIPPINPEMAESAAASTVETALGFIRDLIPFPHTILPTTSMTADVDVALDPLNFAIPMPTPVSTETMAPVPTSVTSTTDPEPLTVASTEGSTPHHFRKPSFLPPHLNVVPEESFLPDNADDFFLSLTEEDWAIGEGLDMDTTN